MKNSLKATCSGCGRDTGITTKNRRQMFRRTGRAYCSETCRDATVRQISSQTMARTNRRYASERMVSNNPMYRQECLEKMRAQLRTIGHRPVVQGGNGRPMPEAQRLMKSALGNAWEVEFVVPTKRRHQGYPSHYKLDIAHPLRKVAVEIDGSSHSASKVRGTDRRKELFLRQNGWLVLRFSNTEVMADSAACARMVMSTTLR